MKESFYIYETQDKPIRKSANIKSTKSTGSRELFEGDIVKVKAFGVVSIGVIEFHNGWNCLALSEKYNIENGKKEEIISCSRLSRKESYHYMGDIFKNPKLLEVEE